MKGFHVDLINKITIPHVSEFLPHKEYSLVNPWYDTIYESTFGCRDGETAEEAAKAQMTILGKAIECEKEMKSLIVEFDEDELLDDENQNGVMASDGMTWGKVPFRIGQADIDAFIRKLQVIALYLWNALKLALETDWTSERLEFKRKCAKATTKLKDVGFLMWQDKSGCPVLAWFEKFKKQRKFLNYLLRQKRFGPPILVENPAFAKRMREYGDGNLADLSVGKMREWVLDEGLQLLTDDVNLLKHPSDPTFTKDSIMKKYCLTRICRSTVHNWMLFLRYKQSPYKKGCYTAIHNKPENVKRNNEVRFSVDK